MIDLNDALFFAGLALALVGAFALAGWAGCGVVVGVLAMAFGLLRQTPRKG